MQNCIVFTDNEGTTKITYPVEKTVEELISNYPNGKIINISEVPKDRKYRSAWNFNGQKIEINLDKAKEIKLKEIRKLRDEKLKELDIDFIKALEDNKDTKNITIEKKRLRDLPQSIENRIFISIEEIDSLII